MSNILQKLLLKSVVVFLILLGSSHLSGQTSEIGLPYVMSFSPRDYHQENQNYSITQDDRGYMYFGNLNGIMIFDNSEWRFTNYKGRPILAKGDNNTIYVGGYNNISTLHIYEGEMVLNKIDLPHDIVPNQINKVIVREDDVLFVGDNDILKLCEDSLSHIFKSNDQIISFHVNKEVYISFAGHGLYVIRQDNLVPVRYNQDFIDKFIIDVFEDFDGNLIIKTESDFGFYKVKNSEVQYFDTQVNDFIESNGYSKGVALSNGNYLFGTIYGGIVCVDSQGNYVFSLNKRNGLLDNHITDIFIDNKEKVWLATYNGINQIEILSSFSYINDTYGLYGAISTIVKYKDVMYYGTSQGVYYRSEKLNYDYNLNVFANERRYEKVQGISGEAQQFIVIGNKLYVASSDGLYCITECKDNKQIFEGQYRKIVLSRYSDSLVFISGKSGLLIGKIENNKLSEVGIVNDLDFDVRTIAQESKDILWLGSNNDGYFRLDFSEDSILQPEITQYVSGNGLPEEIEWADVYYTSFGVLFSTAKGVYQFLNSEFSFDIRFSTNSTQPDSFYPFTEDNNGRLWYNSSSLYGNSRFGYFYLNNEKTFTNFVLPISGLFDYNIECIYCDSTDVVWYGGFDGLVRHRIDETNQNQTSSIIKNVKIGEDNIIHFDNSKIENEDEIELGSNDNSIRINFTSLFYGSYNNVEYQTKLDGFENKWSSWSKENFKDFTNLPPGQYTFRVKARDLFGNISEEAVFKFHVNSPLYYTWWAILIYLAILASLFWLIYKLNEIRHATEKNKLELIVAERTNELVRQKEQTEKLVSKLLPLKTAQEIQETGTAKSRRYDLVTVLFSDIQGFTKITEDTNPEELVRYLNKLFSLFDKIIGNYNIEKIKTIGDAYMCAGGMPDKDRTNPVEVVLAALEMQEKIKQLNVESNYDFKMRVGIHTGNVVAGVVGSKKLEYDIWGDTVNVASRMESHGLVGQVNISELTYDYVKDFFECEKRDKTEVKYKGDLTMYLVKKIKQDISEFSSGLKPNKEFNTKLQSIRISDLEEHMFEKLDKGLPKNLYYHNLKHTINVYYRVEMIAREEGVNEEELLLLKTAAIFHDAGFMVSYDNNEVIGAKMAEDTMRLFKYTDEQIEIVRSLILATIMPPRPKTHLEMIMCDADLDYLGRPDFLPVSQNLFRELFERGKINTMEQWNRMQFKFVQKHKYFTPTAQRLRGPGIELVIADLKKRI